LSRNRGTVSLAGDHQNAVSWQEFGKALEGLLKQ
jgi:hypothetical protein